MLLTLVAAGCIAWLLKTLESFHVARALEGYLACLGLSYLMAYFLIPRVAQTEHGYTVYFAIVTVPVALLAVTSAVLWSISLGLEHGLFAIITSSLACMCFGWLIEAEIPKPTPLATVEMEVFGYCFCLSGLLALASAIPPCSALQFRLRIGFGLFWLLTGAYAFCDALGTFRSRALWDSISGYASQLLCILFLGGLALLLSKQQGEVSHQTIEPEPLYYEARTL